MSAEDPRPLKLVGTPPDGGKRAPTFAPIALRPPVVDSSHDAEYYQESLDEGPPLGQSAVPKIAAFSVVATFTITDDDPPMQPYGLNINLALLKDEWKGTQDEFLCKLGFNSVLVRKISIGNKSTDSTFNAALKFSDKNGKRLFQPVMTFGSDDTVTKSGIPVWGDDGRRLVLFNPDTPTPSQMAFANFSMDDLCKGATHHKYDVAPPSKGRGGGMHAVASKMEITHLPKDPCAKYFEWALCVANEVYPEGFTDHPDHVVGGLPGYFCIHTHDYHKVYDAFNEKQKRVGAHNLEVIKVELEPTDKGHRRLPSGVHSFRIDIEVWVPSRHEDEDDDEEER